MECQDNLFFLGGQVTVGSEPPSADIQSQFLMQWTHKDPSSAAWMTSRNACRAFLNCNTDDANDDKPHGAVKEPDSLFLLFSLT